MCITAQRPDRIHRAAIIDPGRRSFLAAVSAAALAVVVPARASGPVSRAAAVTVERRGDDFLVAAHAQVAASLAQTWATLSDYDRLADFIPDVSRSRTIARAGASATVAQQASATFGPFRQDFTIVLAVEERPFESIRAEAIEGDFRRFDARYDIAALDPVRTRIDYRARLEPRAAVPPLLGVAVMRALVRRQFEAMVVEIARRAARD